MIEWDKVLSWQAEMTDAIDREEIELRAYQSIEQMLLAQRKHAVETACYKDLDRIDTYLAEVNARLKLKMLLVHHLKFQFHQTIDSLL
ncbi:MAG TPA: hypothetical protein VJ824_07640 [Bacillota bacterium]|nr:hypothetical protein [Bacillota bacterium]